MTRFRAGAASGRAGWLVRNLLTIIVIACLAGPALRADGAPPPRPALPHGGDATRGQDDQVDTLLARAVGTQDAEEYDLAADFRGSLTLVIKGAPFTATAEGTYREVRKPGEPRRRKIKIQRLDLPLLLRPFSGSLREAFQAKVDLQADKPETYRAHDMFVFKSQDSGRYVLAGVHRGIVDEAIDRFGQADHKTDPTVRRNIARWLYTSPIMQSWIMRSGPPYALLAVIDESGLIYELALYYDWGTVGTTISYVSVGGQSAWQEIITDTTSDLSGLGRVDVRLILNFSNHCVNCRQ